MNAVGILVRTAGHAVTNLVDTAVAVLQDGLGNTAMKVVKNIPSPHDG